MLINENILIISGLKGIFYLININNYQLINIIQTGNKNRNNCLYKLENNFFYVQVLIIFININMMRIILKILIKLNL